MAKDTGNMKVVMSWSIGLAGIALLGLIMLILFGNLSGNVGFGSSSSSLTVTNETNAFANATGYTLSVVNSSMSSYVLTAVWANESSGTYNVSVPLANVTVSTGGIVNNATVTDYDNVSLSYTYSQSVPSDGLTNTNQFIGNYTTSVLNTGSQFPTVGTIIGVALLLFILIALLIFALTKLARIGGGSGGNFG